MNLLQKIKFNPLLRKTIRSPINRKIRFKPIFKQFMSFFFFLTCLVILNLDIPPSLKSPR